MSGELRAEGGWYPPSEAHFPDMPPIPDIPALPRGGIRFPTPAEALVFAARAEVEKRAVKATKLERKASKARHKLDVAHRALAVAERELEQERTNET